MVEVVCGTLFGYLIALGVQLYLFPRLGITVPLTTNLFIGVVFTAVSLVRSYIVRRFFNYISEVRYERWLLK